MVFPLNFRNKKLLLWIIVGLFVLIISIWLILRFTGEKGLRLLSPTGGEVWLANETYQITWKTRHVDRIGITLIKGMDRQEIKWIARDIPAKLRRHNWQIFTWEEPRQDYKIAVFEYPWQEGDLVEESDFFTIIGPQFASCDALSIEAEWPFLPSDYPDLKKVFITTKTFTGNLEGLEGADKKCQEEAEAKKLAGTWKAFLGNDTALAVDRLNLKGIFIKAEPTAVIPEGKTCHRLLGRNFNAFLKKLSDPIALVQEKFNKTFLKNLENIWLGRITKESKRECISTYIAYPHIDPSRNYSFTTTCHNWSIDKEIVSGYPPVLGQEIKLPICYTPLGKRVGAAGLSGLSSGFIEEENEKFLSTSLGKPCSFSQRLLCIEQ